MDTKQDGIVDITLRMVATNAQIALGQMKDGYDRCLNCGNDGKDAFRHSAVHEEDICANEDCHQSARGQSLRALLERTAKIGQTAVQIKYDWATRYKEYTTNE